MISDLEAGDSKWSDSSPVMFGMSWTVFRTVPCYHSLVKGMSAAGSEILCLNLTIPVQLTRLEKARHKLCRAQVPGMKTLIHSARQA